MNKDYFSDKKINSFLGCNFIITFFVVLVWLAICAIEGIYPMGNMLLTIGDMQEQYVPMYTHLWDAMHGEKTFFFDFLTGLGSNMSGENLHFGLISPFNIFFLFVERNNIEAMMSVFILIKLVAIGWSMSFVLKKWFSEISNIMHISFVLLYVFSAFNMQNYYASMWLDISFMFPLVIYAYFEVLNNKKELLYIIIMTIVCMMGFKHTYMILLMLLILTGMLPYFDEQYKEKLIYVLRSTVIAIMLSAWVLVPGIIQIFSGGRAQAGGGIIAIWNSVWIFCTAKWMKLLNLCIPLAIFFVYAFKNVREKSTRFFTSLIFFVAAPIVLESTNMIWAGGSYYGYPVRHAYMLSFWGIVAGAYAYTKREALIKQTKRNKLLECLCGVLLLSVTLFRYLMLNSDVDVNKEMVSAIGLIAVIGLTFIISVVCYIVRSKWYEMLIGVIVLLQTLTLGIVTVTISEKIDESYIAMSNMVQEAEKDAEGCFERIKSLDVELSHNYPVIMGTSATSNYLASTSSKKLEAMRRLGYSEVGYRMSDYGGTLFSDCLLGVKDVISKYPVNEKLYEYKDTFLDYNIYNSKYYYRQGIRVEELPQERLYDNPFEYQNVIANIICGQEHLKIYNDFDDKSKVEIEIEQPGILYLFADNMEELQEISVWDKDKSSEKVLQIPTSGWLNGILEFGSWERGTVTVCIDSEIEPDNLVIAILPIETFIDSKPQYFAETNIVQDKYSVSINIADGADGTWLFLPLYNDTGWHCTVNGDTVKIVDFAEIFMAIPVEEGINKIQLTYVLPGLKIGVAITIVGLILLLLILKIKKEATGEGLNNVLWWCDKVIFRVIIVFMYIIPILFLLKEFVKYVI